jgi:hypothetical protein
MDDKFELIMIGGIALVLAYIYLNGPRRLAYSSEGRIAYAVDPDLETSVPRTKPVKAIKVKQPGGGSGPNWDCITHRERLQIINNNATVTGTVIPAGDGGPHFAPDGDLVFAFKPDPQYASMLGPTNLSNKKYGGGLWIEGVCQKPNKAKEPRHQGDCKCNATKFTTPKNGQRLKITGAHVKDVGEDGHTEIHPVYTMVAI